MSDLFAQVLHHIDGSETEIQNWQTPDGIKTVEFQSFGPDRWIESVHERGRMTGIECLAIILFALDESLFDPEPARRIVEGWAAELRKAVSTGEIQARDPVTLLALPTLAADLDRARDALHAIPPDLPRDEWVRAGMAAQAAGLDFDAFNDWSAQAGNYDERAARDTWRSFKPGRGVGAGTLYRVAAEHGWRMGEGKPQQRPPQAPKKAAEPQRKPAPGMSPAEVWNRCEPATAAHPYIVAKGAAGVPLDGLRVVPAGDPLHIQGERMGEALVLPAYAPDGNLQSLQCVTTGDTAARLKAKGKKPKLNLPGAPMAGASFTVGDVLPGAPVALCEGVGTAWACWQARLAQQVPADTRPAGDRLPPFVAAGIGEL